MTQRTKISPTTVGDRDGSGMAQVFRQLIGLIIEHRVSELAEQTERGLDEGPR